MTDHTHSATVPGCYRCDLSADESAADLRDTIQRVNAYLAARDDVVPFNFDVVHDIDHGSRGHFRLLASDVVALLYVAEARATPPAR